MLKGIKQLCLVTVGLLSLWSCNKDNNTGIKLGTLSAKVDGIHTDFRFGVEAKIENSGSYVLHLIGWDKQTQPTELILFITSNNKIEPGIYIENSTSRPLVEMYYTCDVGKSNLPRASAAFSTASPVTVSVISIDREFVKGTFSGELSGTGSDGSPMKVAITDGKFHLRVK